MKNKWIDFAIIILGILCFTLSITFFASTYDVLCEMNPDSSMDFGVLLFLGLITLIVGVHSIIEIIK